MSDNNHANKVDTDKLMNTFFQFMKHETASEIEVNSNISGSVSTIPPNNKVQALDLIIQPTTSNTFQQTTQNQVSRNPTQQDLTSPIVTPLSKKRRKNKLDWKAQMVDMLEKRSNEDSNFVIRQFVAPPSKQKPYSVTSFSVTNKGKKKKTSHQQTSSSQQQAEHVTNIPPVVADIYTMSNTSAVSERHVLPQLNQEFKSLSLCDTYWDATTFQLLRFSDNFVHFSGKSKEELIQHSIFYLDCLPPPIRDSSFLALRTIASRQVKQLSIVGIFYRETDQRYILTQANIEVSLRCGYLYVRSSIQPKCNDSFVLDGKEYPMEQLINLEDIIEPIDSRDNETSTFFNPLISKVINQVQS